MDEYISREIAMERIKYKKPKVLYSEYGVGYERGLEDAIGLLNAIPAIDVQLRKHGKWIDCTFYDPCEKSWEQEYEFKCSNCEHKIYNKPSDNNLFCGHCGARMDDDAKNTIATMISKEAEEHE